MGYILTLRSLWGLPPFLPSARRAAEVENGATLFDGREMERGSLRAAETRGVEGGATGRKTGEKTLRAVADAIRLMIAGEVSLELRMVFKSSIKRLRRMQAPQAGRPFFHPWLARYSWLTALSALWQNLGGPGAQVRRCDRRPRGAEVVKPPSCPPSPPPSFSHSLSHTSFQTPPPSLSLPTLCHILDSLPPIMDQKILDASAKHPQPGKVFQYGTAGVSLTSTARSDSSCC